MVDLSEFVPFDFTAVYIRVGIAVSLELEAVSIYICWNWNSLHCQINIAQILSFSHGN